MLVNGVTMAQPENRATIVDIAKAVGVSYKTVSRALNGERHVSTETRERVLEAAKRMNYHPNLLAQSLVRGRSFLIGLVYENPSPSYTVELQMGVLDRLKTERYRLIVIPVRSVSENAGDVVGLLRSAALDGVVLAPPASDHPQILNDLRNAGMPFARIAPTQQLEIGPNTLLDDVAAAREIAAHLVAFGHKDIAIILGNPTHRSSEARLAGYMQAMAEAGIELSADHTEQGDYTFDSGYDAAKRIFAGRKIPTAILAQNDDMAVGALMAARDAGLSVPDDISIVGFDDSEISRIVWPRLTTIHQPVFDMAASATDMLIATLDGGPPTESRSHAHRLLVRASVAAPAKR
jgi:LacI family transcriptional regulator